MTKIKIKRGFYGLHTKNGTQTKGPKDLPFEVDDKEAERLVSLGVATYVGNTPVATVVNEENTSDTGDNTPDNENAPESDLEDDGGDIPEYSIDSNASDLRAIAKSVGITFKVGTTKEDMVSALDEFFSGDMPELDAEASVVE